MNGNVQITTDFDIADVVPTSTITDVQGLIKRPIIPYAIVSPCGIVERLGPDALEAAIKGSRPVAKLAVVGVAEAENRELEVRQVVGRRLPELVEQRPNGF